MSLSSFDKEFTDCGEIAQCPEAQEIMEELLQLPQETKAPFDSAFDAAYADAQAEHPGHPLAGDIAEANDLLVQFDRKHPGGMEQHEAAMGALAEKLGPDALSRFDSPAQGLESLYQAVSGGIDPAPPKEDRWQHAFRLAMRGIEIKD